MTISLKLTHRVLSGGVDAFPYPTERLKKAMQNTLLLNASYEPLRVISWQKAFALIFQEKVDVLEQYSESVRTVSRSFSIPAVIKLRRWIRLTRSMAVIRFSRSNVYARDEYRCQYCTLKFSERELTLDHVWPVVRGGKKTWDNIVAACIRCNQKKSDRRPEEVGLKLLKKPQAPVGLPGMVGSIKTTGAPEIWVPYLTQGEEI